MGEIKMVEIVNAVIQSISALLTNIYLPTYLFIYPSIHNKKVGLGFFLVKNIINENSQLH